MGAWGGGSMGSGAGVGAWEVGAWGVGAWEVGLGWEHGGWEHGRWGWGGSMGGGAGWEHGGCSMVGGAVVGAWLVGCIGWLLSIMDYGIIWLVGQKCFADTMLHIECTSSMLYVQCIQINDNRLFMSLHNRCLVNSQTWFVSMELQPR